MEEQAVVWVLNPVVGFCEVTNVREFLISSAVMYFPKNTINQGVMYNSRCYIASKDVEK
jgi:hypothetical protein